VKDGEIDISILNEKPDGKYPRTAYSRPVRLIVKNKLFEESKSNKNLSLGQYRQLIVGDKITSLHGQKTTDGEILDVKKVPYTTTGLKPDIIFNPMTILKRKTYGHMYEGIISKIAALMGCPIDITQNHTFRTEENVNEMLNKLGIEISENETMYDPDTGAPYKCKIFFVSHYWARQSHLVEQKLNIRVGGSRKFDTGLPEKGRKHKGGQSVDRMSFDSQIAAGISYTIREVHINQGAKIKIGNCRRCFFNLGYFNYYSQEWTCPRCGTHSDFSIIETPPASNLITQTLLGAHIGIEYHDSIDTEEVAKLYSTPNMVYGGIDE
jgi:DNA-directed RNA polymerase beta subunit